MGCHALRIVKGDELIRALPIHQTQSQNNEYASDGQCRNDVEFYHAEFT